MGNLIDVLPIILLSIGQIMQAYVCMRLIIKYKDLCERVSVLIDTQWEMHIDIERLKRRPEVNNGQQE